MVFIKALFFTFSIFARSELLEFTAKQNIHNIKYFFKANDTVFYTKGQKTLAFSSNFKSYEVIKEKNNSEFHITTLDQKNFLISVQGRHHSMLLPNKNSRIYLYSLNIKELELIGHGVNAKFHKNGKYITFYNFATHQITLIRRENTEKKIFLKINSINKFFIPEVLITNDEQLFYTDHNDKMKIGILKYDLDLRKRTTFFKSENITTTLSICNKKDSIYILESSFSDKSFANLYSIKSNIKDISKRDYIYSSNLGPAHSMTCPKDEERIYMIKKIQGRVNLVNEVISVNLSDKKAYIHSDIKFASALLTISDQILLPYRTKIYTLKNKKDEFILNIRIKESNE